MWEYGSDKSNGQDSPSFQELFSIGGNGGCIVPALAFIAFLMGICFMAALGNGMTFAAIGFGFLVVVFAVEAYWRNRQRKGQHRGR